MSRFRIGVIFFATIRTVPDDANPSATSGSRKSVASSVSVIQSMQTYEGKSPVIHRLKRIQNVANILFIFAGISMVDTVYTFTEKWLGNPQLFYSIFYGKWIVVMLVASILELYTTFRISHEMKGEECK